MIGDGILSESFYDDRGYRAYRLPVFARQKNAQTA